MWHITFAMTNAVGKCARVGCAICKLHHSVAMDDSVLKLAIVLQVIIVSAAINQRPRKITKPNRVRVRVCACVELCWRKHKCECV